MYDRIQISNQRPDSYLQYEQVYCCSTNNAPKFSRSTDKSRNKLRPKKFRRFGFQERGRGKVEEAARGERAGKDPARKSQEGGGRAVQEGAGEEGAAGQGAGGADGVGDEEAGRGEREGDGEGKDGLEGQGREAEGERRPVVGSRKQVGYFYFTCMD